MTATRCLSAVSTTTSLLLFTTVTSSQAYTAPLNKGLEVRVCQDKDCLLDGSKETLRLVQSMTPSTSDDNENDQITVTSCGCLGPCGSGPTVDVRRDGIRVKDTREGQDDYFLFRKMNSATAVSDMLTIAGVEPLRSSPDNSDSTNNNNSVVVVTSTRKWYELDRNSRITLQRILYALVALPLLNAHLNGTWDVIGNAVVPNSYYGIGAVVFGVSQFMGTSQRSNALE